MCVCVFVCALMIFKELFCLQAADLGEDDPDHDSNCGGMRGDTVVCMCVRVGVECVCVCVFVSLCTCVHVLTKCLKCFKWTPPPFVFSLFAFPPKLILKHLKG